MQQSIPLQNTPVQNAKYSFKNIKNTGNQNIIGIILTPGMQSNAADIEEITKSSFKNIKNTGNRNVIGITLTPGTQGNAADFEEITNNGHDRSIGLIAEKVALRPTQPGGNCR